MTSRNSSTAIRQPRASLPGAAWPLPVFGASLGLFLLGTGCPEVSEHPVPESKLQLAVLDCGNVTINDLSLLTPGENEGTTKKLTNTCFAIVHPEGTLLWDTGLNDALGPEPVTVFNGGFDLSVTHPLLPQLEDLGLLPTDIDFLALSHFHDDHTGNANAFAAAALLIQDAEYDAAFGATPELYGFDASTYSDLSKDDARILHGKHDVFGDGRVVIFPAPGHSPGHQMLLVDLEETGPVVLSGDLYHFRAARENQTVPSFNADPEATRKSMRQMEAVIKKRGATLWIQHDFEQMSQLRRAPATYQ